mmetsp:Transcript_14522/g.47323  ORF Transcript_14522/g.47323 Transcript_14522/m.47323 type:complete len:233 (-) Transcript_14522:137-835(-)
MLLVVPSEALPRSAHQRKLLLDADALADIPKSRKREVRPDALHHERQQRVLLLVVPVVVVVASQGNLILDVQRILEELVQVRVHDEGIRRQRVEPGIDLLALDVGTVLAHHREARDVRRVVRRDVERVSECRHDLGVHRVGHRRGAVQQDRHPPPRVNAELFVMLCEVRDHRRRGLGRRHHHPQIKTLPQKLEPPAARRDQLTRPRSGQQAPEEEQRAHPVWQDRQGRVEVF